MDVLLISANREMSPYPVFPIGLACVAKPLTLAGHRLQTLDLCFADSPEAELQGVLSSFAPDIVLLSIRNIDNVTYPDCRSYVSALKAVVSLCRSHAPVVLGGSGFSLMPELLLSHLDADYGVVGEGEDVVVPLLNCLQSGADPGALPGVVVRGKRGFIPAEPPVAFGLPERRLFDIDRYFREGGMANVQTKRGCPFSCIYCTYPLLEGTRVRVRPIPEIISEIGEIVDRHGVDYIYFVDDIFNFPTEFAVSLCRAMTEARLGMKWSAFINPQFIDARIIDAMMAAGCDAVEFGTDSGSPQMLKRLGKSFSVDDIRSASGLCTDRGVDFAHYILFGGPGEDETTVMETFELMDEVAPVAVIAMTGIRIYPGTPLFRKAMEEKIISSEADLLEPVFYLSEESGKRLCRLVTEQAVLRKNWVVPGLEINMSDSMLAAIRHFQVRGPLWKLMKRLGRTRVRPMAAP